MVALSLGVVLSLQHAEAARLSAQTPAIEPLQLAESLIATALSLGQLERCDWPKKADIARLPLQTEIVRTTLATALRKASEDRALTLTLSRLRDTLIDLYGPSLVTSIVDDLANVVTDEHDMPLPVEWIETVSGTASTTGSMKARRRDS